MLYSRQKVDVVPQDKAWRARHFGLRFFLFFIINSLVNQNFLKVNFLQKFGEKSNFPIEYRSLSLGKNYFMTSYQANLII